MRATHPGPLPHHRHDLSPRRLGQVAASLDVGVAAQIARAFGRREVQGIEAAGGALTGAEVIGTDATPATQASNVITADAGTDRADIDKELARNALPPATRKDLLTRGCRPAACPTRERRRSDRGAGKRLLHANQFHLGRRHRRVGLTARLS